MTSRQTFIFITTAVMIFGLGLLFQTVADSKMNIMSIQSGLEECPNPTGHTGSTIWVKDCKEFLAIYNSIDQELP
jgi:hypothetical protein